MKKFLIPSLIIAVALMSCDKVDDPFLNTSTTGGSNNEKVRKILIEDYTGQKCGNCPSAALIARNLQDQYGDQIIIASVHVGFFATPNTVGTKYLSDYRTAAGDEYDLDFGAFNLPEGMINRISDNGLFNQGKGDKWGTIVAGIIDEAPLIELEVNTSYTNSSKTLTVDVKATGLEASSGSYNLVLYLTEDNIVDWQTNYTPPQGDPAYPTGDVEEYSHRHMLRDNINGTWGTVFFPDGFEVDDENSLNFSYNVNSNWDESKCSVIAFVYDTDTFEIIQVEEASVQ